jgi:hypothetical protein
MLPPSSSDDCFDLDELITLSRGAGMSMVLEVLAPSLLVGLVRPRDEDIADREY